MKIVIGKFSHTPFHALSKKDISLILKLVPKEWTKQISCVVLSSKIFNKTKLIKPVDYSSTSKQLSIFSRGLVREDIARQLLLKLATIAWELEHTNSQETAELDEVIKPYINKFLQARV